MPFHPWINKIGDYAGKFAGGNKSLGVNGAGIRQTNNSWSQQIAGPSTNPGRFDIPLLKWVKENDIKWFLLKRKWTTSK